MAEPADPHRRRARPRDADRRGPERRRPDAGAVAGDAVRRVVGDERSEDRRRGARRRLKNPSELTVRLETGAARRRSSTRPDRRRVGAALILGHGAGAGQRSTFMVDFARALVGARRRRRHLQLSLHRTAAADSGSRAAARGLLSRGDRRGPRARWRARGGALFIGGKSMGGRIATQVAAADPTLPVAGLVLLGYPLHPPGRRPSAATSICRRSAGRCCSCRAAATRSARRPSSRRSSTSSDRRDDPRRRRRRPLVQARAQGSGGAGGGLRRRAARRSSSGCGCMAVSSITSPSA